MSDDYFGPKRRSSDSDIDELRLELKELNKNVSGMDIKLALLISQSESNHKSMRESVQRNSNEINKHELTLYGNGHPGLTTKVEYIDTLDEKIGNISHLSKWMYSAFIALFLFILGYMFTNLKG